MEGKEKANSIIIDNAETDKLVDKLISTGAEIKVKLNGKEQICYWVKTGFETRPIIRAYAIKRIRDAANAGILEPTVVEKEIVADKDNILLSPSPSCDSNFSVEGLDKINYSYFADIGMVYFSEPPRKTIKVKYSFYDNALYDEIFNNAIAASMIYESLREKDNKHKKIFDSPETVGRLDIDEVNGILSQFTSKVKVDEEEIKKSQGLQVSEEEGDTPKDIK